jgi:hypothetical protein
MLSLLRHFRMFTWCELLRLDSLPSYHRQGPGLVCGTWDGRPARDGSCRKGLFERIFLSHTQAKASHLNVPLRVMPEGMHPVF